ncbi:helix-turn-helix transcriptional regulator [Treponema sp. HNW]|uniref:helix-turn-helix domain-containing protein n=1 Tax=Treponema sp. HNW TaxID=3116654 RepID=UPI003D10E987
MNIGKTLRRIRIKKGISKNELCNHTGFNKGYVYRLENDLVSPTLLTLERVAEAIDERLSDIIVMAEAEQAAPIYKKVSSVEDWGQTADSPLS